MKFHPEDWALEAKIDKLEAHTDANGDLDFTAFADTATSVIEFAKRLLAFEKKVESLVAEWDELEVPKTPDQAGDGHRTAAERDDRGADAASADSLSRGFFDGLAVRLGAG